MPFLERLERRFSWIAIPGLIRYVALLNALVFTLHLKAPGYENMLTLDKEAIFHGEVWRLITWIFIPETLNSFWIFFALLFLWFLGDGLEQSMGAFRTTLFYLTGVIGCTVSALFFGSDGANTFLNLSLLYAFATLHPDHQVLFLFVIPMRIGWLAFFSAIFSVITSLWQPLEIQVILLITLGNYLLYFWPTLLSEHRWQLRKLQQKATRTGELFQREKKTVEEESQESSTESLHRCYICGRTETTNPELEFRVSEDEEEYCMEHLPERLIKC